MDRGIVLRSFKYILFGLRLFLSSVSSMFSFMFGMEFAKRNYEIAVSVSTVIGNNDFFTTFIFRFEFKTF